jgi:SAM-dependent methyltransferase
MTRLYKYGVAGQNYLDLESAKGDTYTCLDGSFPPTNLACIENPYTQELNTAKFILDLGCGVGRNLPWIMENTNATYVGLDPNTNMTEYFWDVQEQQGYNVEEWKQRAIVCNDFSEIPEDIKFDYVVTTFVLQHLGYRYINPGVLNITGITKEIFTKLNKGAVWFSLEHDSEENWIPTWKRECEIEFNVYIRSYKGLPELNERDHTAPNGGHHLMIFKYENNI